MMVIQICMPMDITHLGELICSIFLKRKFYKHLTSSYFCLKHKRTTLNVNKFIIKLEKQSVFLTFIICVLLVRLIPNLLLVLFDNELSTEPFISKQNIFSDGIFFTFFISCFFTPIIETLIFQKLIIFLIKTFISKKYCIQILLSSFIFGLCHYYSLAYVFVTMFGGLFFSGLYVLYNRKRPFVAYAIVVLLHSTMNLITLVSLYYNLQ